MPPSATLSNLPWAVLASALGVLCGVLVLSNLWLAWRVRRLSQELEEETFQRRSLSTTYGRITEQWFPLMPDYPYNPQDFRFLGTPIDGVQFEEDRIVFVEFKTNRSKLSRNQRDIRRIVESGEIYWEEFRFDSERGEAEDVEQAPLAR